MAELTPSSSHPPLPERAGVPSLACLPLELCLRVFGAVSTPSTPETPDEARRRWMDAASLAATCRAAAAFHRSVRVIDECAASLVKFAHRVDAGLGRDWFAGTVHWDEASYALFWSLATRDVALSLGQTGEPRPIRIEKYKWFVNETPAADPRAFLATPVLMQYGHLHSTWL